MKTGIHFFIHILRAAFPALIISTQAANGEQVSNINDSGPGSLRAALLSVNAAGGGTVTFTPSLAGTITLQSPLPDIHGNVTIAGPGADRLVISGNNAYRIFRVFTNATCVLSGMMLRDGYATADSPSSDDTYGGGAVYNEGALEIANCSVTNNRARQSNAMFGCGGGIASVGSLTLSNSIVTGNAAWYRGGGIWSDGTLNVFDSIICSNSVVELNWGMEGGGISADGIVSIVRSKITQNTVWDWGGGIACGGTVSIVDSSIAENEAWVGGGLTTAGTVFMDRSTINDNLSGHFAGGLYNDGSLTMVNCTVSGNDDVGGLMGGGGICNDNTLRTVNCTIAFNQENLSGGGGGIASWGTFSARNTIVAGNVTGKANSPANPLKANDVSGSLTSEGHNLIGAVLISSITGDLTGNVYGVDPRLGPLRNNGGHTKTHDLLPGSPAIDAGTWNGAPAVDQRGVTRPQGMGVDMGAVEFLAQTPLLRGSTATSGMFQGLVDAWVGSTCVIETSSNFADWTPLWTNVIPCEGTMPFADPSLRNEALRFYRASVKSPAGSYIPATQGSITPPFVITNGHLMQPGETNLANSGCATYAFTVVADGRYVIQAVASAPSAGANSFYLNIDAEPQDPHMIWDVPVTSGFEQRTVSWRGNGTDTSNQFVPMVFSLAAGPHQLIIRAREGWTCLKNLTIVALDAAPTVAWIGQDPRDADSSLPGIQAYGESVVRYSAIASDPAGAPLSWQWFCSANGGPSTLFQSGAAPIPAISVPYSAGAIGSTYVWTLLISNGQRTTQSQLAVDVEAPPVPSYGLTIPAPLGVVTPPFVVAGDYVYQPGETNLANSGRALYRFAITNAGNYVMKGMVNAPNAGANSFYVNIDAEPQDPYMTWDVPLTSGFEQRTASWRGNGTDTDNEFVPKVFYLPQGVHTLIIRAREGYTLLQELTIVPYP